MLTVFCFFFALGNLCCLSELLIQLLGIWECEQYVCFCRGVYVAFNGLCAMASVNHLHLHAWYLEYPTFPQTAVSTSILLFSMNSLSNTVKSPQTECYMYNWEIEWNRTARQVVVCFYLPPGFSPGGRL